MKDAAALARLVAEIDPAYEPVRELGRGATSIVYLVRDRALDRNIAVKVIRSSFGPDPDAVARLEREARLVAQLNHPNVVRLYGTRTLADGSLVLLMEHVPGRNLRELVEAEGALRPGRVLSILDDVASALAYAHRRRIVHRDVKPENIYVDDEVGAARLADFGVAKPWDRDTRLTLPGEALGTPAYMSPEQIDDGEVDGRSDVYSLGMVGYEMLAGRHPWQGENLYNIIFKQKNEPLPPLAQVRGDLPDGLVALIERALRKHPDSRFESAEEMLAAIRTARGEGGADTFAVASGPPPSHPVRPQPPPPSPDERSWIDSSWDELAPASAVPLRPSEPEARPAPAPAGGASDPPARRPTEAQEPPPRPAERSPEPRPQASPQAAPPEVRPEVPPAADLYAHAVAAPKPSPHPASEPEKRPAGRRSRWLAVAGVAGLGAVGFGAWMLFGGGGDRFPSAGAEPGPLETASTDAGAPEAPGAPGRPAAIAPAGPVVLEGSVGAVVPVEVRVRDDAGGLLAGVPVRFAADDPAIVAEPDSVESDADGLARTGVRLAGVPGVHSVVATLSADTSRRVRFEVRTLAGPPSRLTPLMGGGQEGAPGALLPQPVGVRVVDEGGNPIAGVRVEFQALEGGGALLPPATTTDSLGRAFARWRMGGEGASQRARVVVAGAQGVDAAEFEAALVGEAAPAAAAEPEPGTSDTASAAAAPAPAPVSVVARSMAVGGAHVCRTGSGTAFCRGSNDRGQAGTARAASPMVALAAGFTHSCGLAADGQAFCWGANDNGQLGDGSRTASATPVEVAGGVPFRFLVTGLSHTCALDGAGRPHCWGRNVSGQLGDGTRDDRAEPRPVGGAATLRTLAAGWNHTCGLDEGGGAWCWGLNGEGQLGDGTRLDRLVPVRMPASPPFQLLAAGNAHTCGVTGGSVQCWGDNGNGQLGTGDTDPSTRPRSVEGLPGPVARVAAGAMHSCALLADGRVYCWGQNLHGQLGDGTTENRTAAVPVAGEVRFRTLEAGGGTTCGVSVEGVEHCWGLNQAGQVGDGTRSNRSVPTRVGG